MQRKYVNLCSIELKQSMQETFTWKSNFIARIRGEEIVCAVTLLKEVNGGAGTMICRVLYHNNFSLSWW